METNEELQKPEQTPEQQPEPAPETKPEQKLEQQNLKAGEVRKEDDNMSMADLLKTEEAVSQKIYSRDIVTVKVIQVTQDAVLVDVGEKKEAVIPLAEFENEKTPQVGDDVQAVLDKKGGEGRSTVMSHRRARERVAIEAVKNIFASKERVKGRITEVIKGGYLVDLNGMRSFMPLSLSELGGAHRHYLPVGAKIKVYVTDFNEKDKKVIVSRRQVLEEDEKVRKTKTLSEIAVGNIVRGVVSKVGESELFVRFQGIEGSVKLEDIGWRDQQEALKKYKRGQRVRCKILSIDKEKEFLTFGFRQLMPNPAGMLKRKYPYRARVKAKIISVGETGAVAKVNDLTDAFIAVEDYSSEGAPKEGTEINAVVVGIDTEAFKLKLSVKRNEEQEDRRKMQQYLKGSPSLTLGQILMESDKNKTEE
jgi:Ribosomal protein S1